MQAFDLSMFPHLVTLDVLADGADATASTEEGFTPGATPLPCRVRSTITHQERFGAGDREVSYTEARVAFPANPGAKKGDRFVRTTDGLILRALAPARARDGDGALFVIECQVVD
jgi:hypothetical protein